ncbi:MAG: hypothetical protein ACOC0O_05510 [Spirochaetota bacterium]
MNPAVILHVASFPGQTVTMDTLRERYGIAPSDEPRPTVGDRPLYFLQGREFEGAVALFDGSVIVAVIPPDRSGTGYAGRCPDRRRRG